MLNGNRESCGGWVREIVLVVCRNSSVKRDQQASMVG